MSVDVGALNLAVRPLTLNVQLGAHWDGGAHNVPRTLPASVE